MVERASPGTNQPRSEVTLIPSKWEKERSRLHHDVFHHQIYHFLASSEEALANSLMKGASRLPASVCQAIANWHDISLQLHELFDRASREALGDPQVELAHMALNAVGDSGSLHLTTSLDSNAVAEVQAKANEIIDAGASRYMYKIERALAEPRRLLLQLDGLIASFRIPREPISEWDAKEQVQNLIDVCRHFDRALSAIPSVLRGSRNDG